MAESTATKRANPRAKSNVRPLHGVTPAQVDAFFALKGQVDALQRQASDMQRDLLVRMRDCGMQKAVGSHGHLTLVEPQPARFCDPDVLATLITKRLFTQVAKVSVPIASLDALVESGSVSAERVAPAIGFCEPQAPYLVVVMNRR